MPEPTFKEYMARKWPEYCDIVLDLAVDIIVAWKLGYLSSQERDDQLEKIITPKSQKKLLDIANSIPN